MGEFFIIISGAVAGVVMWLPCGVGISAHRHAIAGVPSMNASSFIAVLARPPKSFSFLGRVAFGIIMMAWLCIFFGAAFIPTYIAQTLGLELSSSVSYALVANLVMAIVCFFAGDIIWRKLAHAA